MSDALGYAWVSTGDRDVAGQTSRLTRAGAIKVFTDGCSGRAMDRPGLEALLAYARHGDALAIVRLDRLGRTPAELLATVSMLKERGIALVSLEEKIDTNSAAGELVFRVFGAIAQMGLPPFALQASIEGAGQVERWIDPAVEQVYAVMDNLNIYTVTDVLLVALAPSAGSQAEPRSIRGSPLPRRSTASRPSEQPRPINDRDQVKKATPHWNVGQIGAPDLVRCCERRENVTAAEQDNRSYKAGNGGIECHNLGSKVILNGVTRFDPIPVGGLYQTSAGANSIANWWTLPDFLFRVRKAAELGRRVGPFLWCCGKWTLPDELVDFARLDDLRQGTQNQCVIIVIQWTLPEPYKVQIYK